MAGRSGQMADGEVTVVDHVKTLLIPCLYPSLRIRASYRIGNETGTRPTRINVLRDGMIVSGQEREEMAGVGKGGWGCGSAGTSARREVGMSRGGESRTPRRQVLEM